MVRNENYVTRFPSLTYDFFLRRVETILNCRQKFDLTQESRGEINSEILREYPNAKSVQRNYMKIKFVTKENYCFGTLEKLLMKSSCIERKTWKTRDGKSSLFSDIHRLHRINSHSNHIQRRFFIGKRRREIFAGKSALHRLSGF